MRPGHRRMFPVAINAAREDIAKVKAKQKREADEEEEIRKREKDEEEEQRKREKARQKREDEKKEELAKISMERELQQARNTRDIENQEQKLKGTSTDNIMKDGQQARVDSVLPATRDWAAFISHKKVIHICFVYEDTNISFRNTAYLEMRARRFRSD